MAQGTKSSQNGRHQTPHQGAIAVRKRFQPGMRAGPLELLVEGPVLVEYAIKNVRGDAPRGEAGHLG